MSVAEAMLGREWVAASRAKEGRSVRDQVMERKTLVRNISLVSKALGTLLRKTRHQRKGHSLLLGVEERQEGFKWLGGG